MLSAPEQAVFINPQKALERLRWLYGTHKVASRPVVKRGEMQGHCIRVRRAEGWTDITEGDVARLGLM